MSHQWGVRDKIWGIVALFMFSLCGLSGLSVFGILAERQLLMEEKKQTIRLLVESAHSVLSYYENLHRTGQLSLNAAQNAAKNTIRAMRYGSSEYFWINDFALPTPRMIMHPMVPELEGQQLDSDDLGFATSLQAGLDGPVRPLAGPKKLFIAFNEIASQEGHGYITYRWPKLLVNGERSGEQFPKLSYVRKFEAWDWLIGSGIYIDDIDQVMHEQLLQKLGLAFGIGSILLLLASLLAASICKPLVRSAHSLAAMTRGSQPLAPLPVDRADEIGTLIAGFNQLQAALAAKENHLRLSASVFENAREGIIITDPGGRIINVNPGFTTLTGYTADEAIGRNPSLLKSGLQNTDFYSRMWHALLKQGYWQGEISNRRKNGEIYVEMLTITSVHDNAGQISHYVGIFSDVTSLKEQQQRLEYMAHYDALTELPNRTLLADRLRLALTQASRKQDLLAVAFLDLDGFKPVNDRLGHDSGDQLLIETSRRLKRCIRAGDTVARLGGDEFVLLLVGLENSQEVHNAMERVLEALSTPCQLKGENVSISASIGVTLYPLDGADPDVLLRHADQAMYAAKQAGRNRYQLFDTEHDRQAHRHRECLLDIRRALADNEFTLFYQPKVNMRQGKVIGAEALIRWSHRERGLLLPDAFLPLIDGSDLDIAIGDWVIESALKQMEIWQSAGLELQLSVNVTAAQLQENGFVRKLEAALARHPGLPPFSLELEILETAALDDVEHVSQVIEECRGLGITFALDDFGTGYSSLTYFKRLPAHMLKIDRSFVCDMLSDPDDLAIVEGVISFTQAFQREVIAEGVETGEHGAMLLQHGCDLGQGFGIARPMPADAVPAWVESFQPDAKWGSEGAPLKRIVTPAN